MRKYYVYILCSGKNGTLYIGVTNNLSRRIYEHKEEVISGFSKKYNVKKLVYVEIHSTIADAIYREKVLKKWNRQWKIRLIEGNNPDWNDLYEILI